MGFFRRGALGPVSCFLVAASLPACASKKATAIVVAVNSESSIPQEIDGFEVEVQRGDSTPFFQTYELGPVSAGTHLPGTITLQNRDGEDASQSMTVIIRARLGGKMRVLRQATLGFSDQKTKLLKMPLRYSCVDFPSECPSGSSCRGGACAPDAVDVATLPEYSSDLVFGAQGASTCFDDRLTSCLKSLVDVDLAALAATTDCSFTVPAGAGSTAKLNVAVHWKVASAADELTVLEVDPQEGWSYTAKRDGFTLAPGLCALAKSGAVTRIAYSTQCDPKSLEQPICEAPAGSGDGSAGAGGSTGTGGTTASGGAAGATAVGTSCAALVGSCNIPSKLFCEEYYGAGHVPTAQNSCPGEGGTWSTKGCSKTTTGFVGTCPTSCTKVGEVIGYYYNGDPVVAQSTCTGSGNTWVPASGSGGAAGAGGATGAAGAGGAGGAG